MPLSRGTFDATLEALLAHITSEVSGKMSPMHCSSPVASSHGLLTTMAFQPGSQAAPQYALEGAVAATVAVLAGVPNMQLQSGKPSC